MEGDVFLKEIFDSLLIKFKGVKKSREEMVKYCMRKACGFIDELIRKKKISSLDFGSYVRQFCLGNQSRLIM